MNNTITIQINKNTKNIPKKEDFINWITKSTKKKTNITIKIVNKKEITFLNKKYKNKKKETNVLAFKYQNKKLYITGDIILCSTVIKNEAKKNKINELLHWCHMTIHGLLHLLNYSHNTKETATKMHNKEKKLINSIFNKK